MIEDRRMRALVIVPAYNEARNLPAVLEELRAQAPDWDVCVVDDGSADATGAVAREHGARVLRLPLNLGIGGAVQTGYLWARQNGYAVAAQIDADGQHDPRFLSQALSPIAAGAADVVIGSRYLRGEGFQSSRLRRAGSRYLSWFLRLRCGARVTDPTSGFRVAGSRAIALFATNYPSDYPEPEAIALARRRGLTVREVPVSMRSRGHGESSIGPGRTLYYLVKVSLALLLLPVERRANPEIAP
jgi:glycosyltransferase involved in cell wall biosynthesis